ncbi:MAG TPA: hypothetical protein VK014_15255 [Cyclobacteriaceae bacterium]|nr:hypothetical protein [Cyclobacteriaceae bacterium]
MEYFRIKNNQEEEIFVNLCNVLWVAFSDERYTIAFYRCESDALTVAIHESAYEDTKEKLMKVLQSSTRVVLD